MKQYNTPRLVTDPSFDLDTEIALYEEKLRDQNFDLSGFQMQGDQPDPHTKQAS